jgi:ribose 5-phosphate isomerase A
MAHGYPRDIELVRRHRNGEDVVTDNGNYIVDVHLGRARDIGDLTVELNTIPGVVENGFFHGTADEVVFGWPDGSAGIFELPFAVPVDIGQARDRN